MAMVDTGSRNWRPEQLMMNESVREDPRFALSNVERRVNRGTLEISADILRAALQGPRKTRLMYRASLSYDLVDKYISKLTATGLLTRHGHPPSYHTTDLGRQFLAAFEEMQSHGAIFYERLTTLERLLQVARPNRWVG